MSASRVDQPILSRTAPWAISGLESHGFQHVGRLHLAGRAGRARRHRNSRQIEADHGGFGLQTGHREQSGIRQPLHGIGEHDDAGGLPQAILQPFPQAFEPNGPSAGRLAMAAAAAAPKPAIPATFSVPARRPSSWPPPRSSGSSPLQPLGQDQRADALGAADLVRRQRQQIGIQSH